MGVSKNVLRVAPGVESARPAFRGKARPAYVSEKNVYEAALDRIRWLYDEFDGRISVSTSGGKDSTVVMELALMVAKEKGCLPLDVMWLDQECEYAATVNYMRGLHARPELSLRWYQIPFRLYNSTNHDYPWLNVWGEGEEWVRPKEPYSIHVNDFLDRKGEPISRFKDLLQAINARQGGVNLTGMRTEESPARRLALTTNPTYKWATWGSMGKPLPDGGVSHYLMHPIYDWSFKDIWKAIYDHGWAYNTHYDVQFQYGVPVRNMRVSNYHHETALSALLYLQEAEPETWEAATKRLHGINTYSHIGKESVPEELPYMFRDWEEYLFHLIDNLCDKEEYRETYRAMYEKVRRLTPENWKDDMCKRVARAVVNNDLYGTTIDMFLIGVRGSNPSKGLNGEKVPSS